MSDGTGRLNEIRERWDKPNPHASAANSQRAIKDVPFLLTKIDRLQAIVDTRPKTADGVPVNVFAHTPPTFLWVHHLDRGIVSAMVVGWIAGVWEGPDSFLLSIDDSKTGGANEADWPVTDCYSTPEAAEQAKEEK